jgi:AcrR family transcriptional regulator
MSKGEVSQEKILEAAFGLFVAQGYHGTSMRQIAEQAGLAPASLYNHFPGKEEIFYQLILLHHPFRKILPILESAGGDDAEAMIRDVASRVYEVMRTRKELLHLLFIEMVEFDGSHLGEIFRMGSPRIFAFVGKLQEKQGSLRPVSSADILLSIMGLVMSQWMLETVFLKNIDLPGTENHFEAALDIFLHGILATEAEA